ncbi:MAG: hypothetical protein M9924_14240 [Rhizobiaceae bacterium]|nr:hypothetical protein [Rhizobiaceae bacterium]
MQRPNAGGCGPGDAKHEGIDIGGPVGASCGAAQGSAILRRMKSVCAYGDAAVTPSSVTRHAELLRLCARIGYSPPCG